MTITNRFFISFFANGVKSAIGMLTALLLARWLGPKDFGRYSFLIVSSIAFKQLLDCSSSFAFFTFLSREQRSKTFVSYFKAWVGLQLFILVFIIGILLPESVREEIWKDETRVVILLALVASFIQSHLWPIASQMAEAQRATTRFQQANVILVFAHLLATGTLWYHEQLTLSNLFILIIFEWGIASIYVSSLYRFDKANHDKTKDSFTAIVREFSTYCLPMIPYVYISFCHDFADRWLLQHYGGSIQQGYFSVAFQIGAISLLATISVLRILWKEVAEAHHQNDMDRVKLLFEKTSRILFFIGLYASGSVIWWSHELIDLLLGHEYHKSAIVMGLMLIYPIHQSLGQVCGTMYYAIGLTKQYMLIGILNMTVSIVVTYFFLAPREGWIPGLGLGSIGLATKMIVMQFIIVNVLLWRLSVSLKWKFSIAYQIWGFAIFLGLGWGAQQLTNYALPNSYPFLLKYSLSFLLYTPLCAYALFLFPSFLNMSQTELKSHVTKAYSFMANLYKKNLIS